MSFISLMKKVSGAGSMALAAVFSLTLVTQSSAQTSQEYNSMAGKTVLITGSTDGMGREVATRLGALGAHVIVHGRSEARANDQAYGHAARARLDRMSRELPGLP